MLRCTEETEMEKIYEFLNHSIIRREMQFSINFIKCITCVIFPLNCEYKA